MDPSPSPEGPTPPGADADGVDVDAGVRDGGGPAARATGRLGTALGLATLAMLGLSWPLWVAGNDFPRVPFVPGLSGTNAPLSWVVFAALLGAVAGASATSGAVRRGLFGTGVAVLAFLILGDQQRLQAWAYQYAMIALFLATLPATWALRLARGWYVATYAYSGLSKLDVSFCRELGGTFLLSAARPLGLEPGSWPPALRYAAILAMPVGEIALALGLVAPSTRRPARWGAVALHAALIALLGPWPGGLGHSTIVLVWNAAMLVEVWIAFGPAPGAEAGTGTARGERVSPLGWLAAGAFGAGVLLPLGERWGFCDAWPAHALYASHVERTEVFLHEDELGAYPAGIARHVRVSGPGPWQRLDLTGWSRATRGVPVYPQGRACNGLAEALAACYGDHRLIRVVQWGRADRWTGRRDRVALLGLDEIRRRGTQYRLNAHPAPGFGPSPPESTGAHTPGASGRLAGRPRRGD